MEYEILYYIAWFHCGLWGVLSFFLAVAMCHLSESQRGVIEEQVQGFKKAALTCLGLLIISQAVLAVSCTKLNNPPMTRVVKDCETYVKANNEVEQ